MKKWPTIQKSKQLIHQQIQRSHIEAAVTTKAEIFHLKFQRNFQVTKTGGDDKANYQIDMRRYYERIFLITV